MSWIPPNAHVAPNLTEPTPNFLILLAVRYLDLMRGPQGQPLQTPLTDIIAHLEASSRSSSDDGRGGSAACGAAHQQQQHQRQQQQQQQRCPCTIIYTHRREDADRVAAALRKRGFACSGGWHAVQGLVGFQAGRLMARCCTCMSHGNADRIAHFANLVPLPTCAAAYHAGLPDSTRSHVLQDWQAGSLSVIAATVAFGMGVDKAGEGQG